MRMADVAAVFGTMLAVGLALPGLLLTWRLLLPGVSGRAEERLSRTPWLCLGLGLAALSAALIPLVILFNLPAGLQAAGFAGTFLLLAITSLGAAGLAGLMGERLRQLGLSASGVGATVWGAVALELAVAFPLVGWFILLPLAFSLSLGAALFALLGWLPRPRRTGVAAPAAEQAAVSG